MKKFLVTLVFCCAALAVYADMDLRVQNFSGVTGGTAKVVSTGWKNYGLQLTADQKSDLRITYKQLFTFYPGKVYKLSADISGNGVPFAELRFLDIDNRPLKQAVIPMQVRIHRGELKAFADLRKTRFEEMPSRFQVIIGVKKGTSLLIEDVEFEVDNDWDD